MPVTEKTLEMNVSEHLIRHFRPTYPKVFLKGFSLRHEKRTGLDVSIDLPHNVSICGLQFKRPLSVSGGIYRFEINNNNGNDQHLKLYLWSFVLRYLFQVSPISYAFPLFYDTTDVANASPDFLPRTHFIKPIHMPDNLLDNNLHIVQINTMNNRIDSWSKSPTRIKEFLKGNKFVKDTIGNKQFVPVEILESRIKNLSIANIKEQLKNEHIFKLFESSWDLKLKGLAIQ